MSGDNVVGGIIMDNNKRITIQSINVQKLFGLYDYVIPERGKEKNIEDILVLYGANGSGKTTILSMIFHLLATELRRGHKTIVAKTKFRSITIRLSNGYEVRAYRKNKSLLGSFAMELKRDSKINAKTEFIADSMNVVRAGGSAEEENTMFLNTMAGLGLSLYFLSDDRKSQISTPYHVAIRKRRPLRAEEDMVRRYRIRRPYLSREVELKEESSQAIVLLDTIENAAAWVRHQTVRGATKGESDVYSDIINRITDITLRDKTKKSIAVEDLTKRILDIERRNKAFSAFGFTPSFVANRLLKPIREAKTKNQKSVVAQIAELYLDNFEAKLNALNSIQERVKTLVDTLNNFFVDKKVDFNIVKGFVIKVGTENLSPLLLSSGERHLLLLFLNTITTLDRQSVFIIDEPEISLNVTWQRILISALCKCAKGSPIQYIFATHSIELLTQHYDKVVELSGRK